jgi:type VI secretion system protein ImpL
VVTWPGPRGNARLDAMPSRAGESKEYSGPWALFRLLDHAAVQEAGAPSRFKVVFDVGGRHASFVVDIDRDANPFRLRELEHFECPLPGR